MHAEVIAIGDELTSGQRLDTNSQWLSQRLTDIGIHVLYHSTVGDQLEAGVRVFREALDRADVIVCTGGLGPTADDLTRQAIAEATRTELVRDESAYEHIRGLFQQRRRPMPATNEIQAYFPAGSRVIPNPHGTAPGIDLEVPRGGRPHARLFALPGVPAEMHEMWQATLLPILDRGGTAPRRVIRHRRIKCFGVGESDLEQMLPDLIRRGREPTVGITVSQATITLRITSQAPTAEDCQAAMQPTADTILQCLGPLVFGEEDEELQDVVVRMLESRNQTLSVAEIATGGLLSYWLSEADPERRWFLGSVIAGRSDDVTTVLAGEATHAGGWDAMQLAAERCRARFAADYGLLLGPLPVCGASQAPGEGIRCVLTGPGEPVRKTLGVLGHPSILKPRTAKQALNLLRLHLLGEISS